MDGVFLRAYESAFERAVYFDLSAYGKIAVTGPDAATFLHNLCSNDIKNLPVGGGCEAFFCNARARTLAHVLISRWPDGPSNGLNFLLDMVPSLHEKMMRHLDKYLISEQVEIVDRTQDLALFRLIGPKSADVLGALLGSTFAAAPAPLRIAMPWTGPGQLHIRPQTVLAMPGFDIFCARDSAVPLMEKLAAAGAIQAAPEVHEVLRIEAGTPEYGKEMDDDRFVMEVGRTAQAISYTKGCYLGQEPIVMARDRGQVNRTLMGVMFAGSTEAIPPGSKLFAGETEVGLVTSSAWSPRLQQVLALAYVRRGNQQPGSEFVCDGRKGVLSTSPFGIRSSN